VTQIFSALLHAVRRKEHPIALIASLPCNDPALAKAALEGGADVVKVHINVQHRASGTLIGSLDEEKPALDAILNLWQGKPVGIVPGGPETMQRADLPRLVAMGFSFLSFYLHDSPAGVLPPTSLLERMLAFSSSDSPSLAEGIDAIDVQVIELSIMAPDSYGQPLTAHDLLYYATFRRATQLPLVVPSQHNIPPEAVPDLARVGIEGIMLGSIVCGKTPESWYETFRKFDQVRKN
jgi:hypothetical protein